MYVYILRFIITLKLWLIFYIIEVKILDLLFFKKKTLSVELIKKKKKKKTNKQTIILYARKKKKKIKLETTKQRLTRRLKPVTPEREMAIALLERASSPRWPTIIIEMISNMYCDRATATIGPAKEPNFLSSSVKVAHVRDDGFVSDLLLPSSWIPFANKLSSMSLSISVSRETLWSQRPH